jgi:hypothetical protein
MYLNTQPPAPLRHAVPTSHRSLAHLAFPRSRWLHVLLLPAVMCAAVWWLAPWLAWLWAQAVNHAVVAFDLNGLLLATPANAMRWESTLLLADVPAPRPTTAQVFAGALVAALLLAVSYLLPLNRTAMRYFVRAVSLCHASAVAFFGLWDVPLPYTLSSHLEGSLTMVWMFMLVIPWLHALSYNVFGFGLWRELALTLGTLVFLAVFAPVQYFFHLCVVQQQSLLYLPSLYFLGGLLLEVMIFVSLYAWAMSWAAPEHD